MGATSLIRPRWLLSAAAAALIVVVGLMLNGITHAGVPLPQCISVESVVCISLDPETDTNDTGTNHTVTASVTLNDEPFPPGGVEVAIIVFQGPNTFDDPDNLDAFTEGSIDENGQLSLTYAGDGGPGTDTIGAVACLELAFPDGASEASGNGSLCGVAIGSFIDLCLNVPEACLIALTSSEGLCALQEGVFCDTATKEWVEPTPSPTPTPDTLVWGDWDCDSTVGTRDSQALLRNVLEQNALSQTQPCPLIGTPVTVDGNARIWGDGDCDSTVGTRDSQAILRFVLEQNALSQTQPCPLIGDLVQVSD